MLINRKRLAAGVTISIVAMLPRTASRGAAMGPMSPTGTSTGSVVIPAHSPIPMYIGKDMGHPAEASPGRGVQYSMPFAALSSGAVQFDNGGFGILGQSLVGTISNEQYTMEVGIVPLLVATPPSCSAIISELEDPENVQLEGSVDIVGANIKQEGSVLTFSITTRGDIPTALPQPDDKITYLWLVDADQDPQTGQPHGELGSEFNVRAVISETYGGGFVDVTGKMPGGGQGTVTVEGNQIAISITLDQIGNPGQFNWRSEAFSQIGQTQSGNGETAVASATVLDCVSLIPLVLPSDAKHQVKKHRYLSIDPSTNPTRNTVIKVVVAEMRRCQNDPRRGCLVDLDCRDVCDNDPNTLCPTGPGVCGGGACINSGPCVDVTPNPAIAWLVQEPAQIQAGCLKPGCNGAVQNCCGDTDWVARLSDNVYVDANNWQDHDLIHISDCGISPGITYAVYACDPGDINLCSEPLLVGTQATPSGTHVHFGDIAGSPINAGDPYEPPDGFVNVVDVSAWGLTKQNYGTPAVPQLHPTMADIHGGGVGVPANYILGLSDQEAVIKHGFTNAKPWDTGGAGLGGVDPSVCPDQLP